MLPRSDIESALRRAGCQVYPGATVGALGAACVRADCGDGWGAARYLVELSRHDHRLPEVQAIAQHIRAQTITAAQTIAQAVAFVKARVAFRPEEGEVFQSPAVSLALGYGDCDCHARLLVAILRAAGIPTRFGFLSSAGGQPRHVVAQAWDGEAWRWLETTVKGACIGEHPVHAAVRVGALRPDVQADFSEVTTMGGPVSCEDDDETPATMGDATEDALPDTLPEQDAARGPATDGTYFPPVRTSITKADFASAVRAAWPAASREAIAVLWGMWAIESGRGQACWNWNIGNVKKTNGDGHNYTMLSNVKEKINGEWQTFQPPDPQTWFRAFPDLATGMREQIEFLRKKYGAAWTFVELAQPAAFVHALKVRGYFTGDEGEYTKAVVSLTREFLGDAGTKLVLPIGGFVLITGGVLAAIYGAYSAG